MSLKGNTESAAVALIDTTEIPVENTSNSSAGLVVEMADENPHQGRPAKEEQEPTTTTTTTTTNTASAPAAVAAAVPWWFPKCCGKPIFRGNPEALGYALDLMSRSTTFACAGAFLLPALLNLAKLEAGCSIGENDNDVPCEGKVYGIRPSSLLTTILTIVGVVSAALLPVMGAIVDATPYRRFIGRILSPMLCALLIPTILVNEHNWFAVSIIFIVLSFLAWCQAMINYAYLPELTQDQAILNEYTRGISILSFSFIVVFLATVVAVSAAFNLMNDYLTVARISQSMTFTLLTTCSILSYGFLYGPRPAARQRSPISGNGKKRSIWTAGFIQLYATIQKIHAHYPALQYFYCAIAMSNSAIGSLLVINMTFLTDQLLFSSQTIGTCVTIMLLLSIPGAVVSFYFTKRFNPVNSSMASLVLMIIVTTVVSIVLKEPGQYVQAYLLSGAWGLAMGWNFTCDRMVISSIIPKHQEAELMALFLFAGQALNWLPPLIYTSMNEANISPRIGIAMLNIFFVLGIVFYILMGSYEQALAMANSSRNTVIMTTTMP